MKVPLYLVMRSPAAPAEAYLLLSDSAEALVPVLGIAGPTPEIYRVHGGFLLQYPSPPRHEPRAAIRLRKLGSRFYLPADAELRPAFLADELSDLAKRQGIIALPGGCFLAFDPQRPLTPDQWVALPAIRRSDWQPIPLAPYQPERLTRIEFPSDSPAAVLEILNEGQPDGAEPLQGYGEGQGTEVPEEARPPGSGLGMKAVAGAALAGAQMLVWLGKQLGLSKLANLGAEMARKALEQVPRLTEKVLGAQEAALREVLRQLQSGDVEDALRRAPIAVGDPDAKSTVGSGADLGRVDPRYNLRNLLSGGSGPASAWLGGGDVWYQLQNEYRRLAQAALARGDFRRAAYLYGVLLRDLRSAANALASGGLHRDAAILYRDKLNDPLAAAQSFERAGEVDEAVRLYEKLARYEDAAELLRRFGEETRAEEYFLRAARVLAEQHHWVQAGDLVRNKLGRRDLAVGYYRAGWDQDFKEVVPCGHKLLDEYLVVEDTKRAEELFSEAEERFAAPRRTEAEAFFNYALRVREFVPVERRFEWRDRVRMLFAKHVWLAPKPLQTAGDCFGHSDNWAAEVHRDAAYAAKRLTKVPEVKLPPSRMKKLLDGTVVAVAVAKDSRDIVVASTTGVVCWRVKEDRVQHLEGAWIQNEVLGLSVDAQAENVFVLSRNGSKVALQNFQMHVAGYFKPGGVVVFDVENVERGEWYLSQGVWDTDGEPAVVLANSQGHFAYRGHIPKAHTTPTRFNGPQTYFVAINSEPMQAWSWGLGGLAFDWGLSDRTWQPHWHPDTPVGSSLVVSPIDAIVKSGELELVAVDRKGILGWAKFEANVAEEGSRSRQIFSTHTDRFAAACLIKSETIAAVTFRNELHWLRVSHGKLVLHATSTQLDLPSQAVYLAARPVSGEVAVILEDGSAMLVRVP